MTISNISSCMKNYEHRIDKTLGDENFLIYSASYCHNGIIMT